VPGERSAGHSLLSFFTEHPLGGRRGGGGRACVNFCVQSTCKGEERNAEKMTVGCKCRRQECIRKPAWKGLGQSISHKTKGNQNLLKLGRMLCREVKGGNSFTGHQGRPTKGQGNIRGNGKKRREKGGRAGKIRKKRDFLTW